MLTVVLLLLILILYPVRMPFLLSSAGGDQVTLNVVDVIDEALTFSGAPLGSAKTNDKKP